MPNKPDKPDKPDHNEPLLDEILARLTGLATAVKFVRRAIQRLENNNNEQHIQIMSAISDYAAAVNASYDEIDASQTALETAVTGVADDVAYQKDGIDKLQNSPGQITPEDQALLDAAQA